MKMQRNRRGSMLTMTLLCIGLAVAACVIGFALYMMMSEQKRGQATADILALAIAKKMNSQNRIGELNNLIARNRELVYTSRLTQTNCDNSFLAFASPLAQQLLNEACTSNVQIDKERRNQMGLIKKTVVDTVDDHNKRVANQPALMLPWWQTYAMEVVQVNGGCIANVQSNVVHTEIYDDLNYWDTQAHYFQPKSMLYMGNSNAKLPSPDNSFDFKFCSLPAPVETAVAPPRLANPEAFVFKNQIIDDGKFVNQSFDQIPSAVQVLGHMDVTMRNDRRTVQVGSVAETNGGAPPFDRPPDVDSTASNGWGNGPKWGTTPNSK